MNRNGVSKQISYFYDDNGQLIRENNQVRNKTIVYKYDKGGNITSREEYPYKIEDLTNSLTSKYHGYSYGNSKWKDQLTSYDGKSIVYDEIGNPTTYLGATLSWDARDLISYTKNNKKICYTYNVSGVRRSKTVDGKKTTYDYAGDKLVHEYREANDMDIYYTYDIQGYLVMISTLKNEYLTNYYVAINSRGDERKNI